MNTKDIEKFMREAGRGEHGLIEIRTFAQRAADALKALPKWRKPDALQDTPSAIILALGEDKKVWMFSHLSGESYFGVPMVGWIALTEIAALEIEK